MRISPPVVASIGLAILAFAAPGKAHAELLPEPIAAPPSEPGATVAAPPPPPAPAAPYEYEADGARYARWRLAAGIGVRFGSFTVNGDSTGIAIPFHLDLGVRHRRLYLFGSYDLFSIDAPVPDTAATDAGRATAQGRGDGSGLVHRAGASARYAIGRFGENDGGLDLWAEGGLGVQHVRWDAGGVWTRPDVSLGLGASAIILERDAHAGFTIGLHVTFAPRNDTDGAPAVCGGPCDRATAPSGIDRSFLLELTLPCGL